MDTHAPHVSFRAARAADSDAAVPLILSSGPDAFAYVFATRLEGPHEFLRHAFINGRGEFGYRNHIVGELGGRIVAAGAGWTASATLAFTLAAPLQCLTHYGWLTTPGVILRGLRAEAIIRPPGPGEFYIGHLGVDPACRGQGIGEALVARLTEAGRAAGCSDITLDVATTNPRAQALYERLGFRVTAERPSTLRRALGCVPPSRRMARAL